MLYIMYLRVFTMKEVPKSLPTREILRPKGRQQQQKQQQLFKNARISLQEFNIKAVILMLVFCICRSYYVSSHSKLPRQFPWNSVESDLGRTSRIHFDNMTLMLHKVTLTSLKPCQHNNKCDRNKKCYK